MIDESKIFCYAIDNETAMIVMDGKKYVLDYGALMEFMIKLGVVAGQMENELSSSTGHAKSLNLH